MNRAAVAPNQDLRRGGGGDGIKAVLHNSMQSVLIVYCFIVLLKCKVSLLVGVSYYAKRQCMAHARVRQVRGRKSQVGQVCVAMNLQIL